MIAHTAEYFRQRRRLQGIEPASIFASKRFRRRGAAMRWLELASHGEIAERAQKQQQSVAEFLRDIGERP